MLKRREFLKQAGSFVATAGVAGMLGCGDDAVAGHGDAGDAGPTEPGSFEFPEGVASGDPRPTSVMLWTRVAAVSGGLAPIALTLEVSKDDDFKKLVVSEALESRKDSHHTLRVLVEGLEADTIYHYRFVASQDTSRTGRTWTAPKADADVPVRFAWASCQDYASGFYGAYRRMLNDDETAPENERLRFVLHVGDFIYETRGEGFQVALDDDLNAIELIAKDGKPRMVPPFPSGTGMPNGAGSFAQTVDDYRHLYETFLHDPDLQDARARWPFICIWDDHEFSDDCWQTQANYTNNDGFDEASQRRRVAANQAWFEFIPAILSEAESADGVASAADDFKLTTVADKPYSDAVDVDESNNAKAIGSLTIYRRLRFGKHVDLVLTDNRAYRSDHAIAEELTKDNALVFHPRAGLPLVAVNAFDAGMTANGGMPDAMILDYENTRINSPPGTILGAEQKQWWKDVLSASTASFKVWGNSLPLVRIRLDTTGVTLLADDLVLSADSWDGYPSERRELMTFLKDEGIRNVVSLSGDHHAHFAGLVHDDYDASDPTPVMVDFATGGISSSSQFASIAGAVETAVSPDLKDVVAPVLKLIVYDATAFDGDKAVVNLNALIRYGAPAATIAAETNDLAMIEAARNPDINSHLRYVDCAANGYGLASFDASSAEIKIVTVERPVVDTGSDGLSIRATATFVVPNLGKGEALTLSEPEVTGKKPFPLA